MVKDGVEYPQVEFWSNGERRSGVSSSSFGAMVEEGVGVPPSRVWEQW